MSVPSSVVVFYHGHWVCHSRFPPPPASAKAGHSFLPHLFITQRNLPNSNRFLYRYGYIVPPYFARHSLVVVMVKLPLRGSPLKLMDASGTMTLPDVFSCGFSPLPYAPHRRVCAPGQCP